MSIMPTATTKKSTSTTRTAADTGGPKTVDDWRQVFEFRPAITAALLPEADQERLGRGKLRWPRANA
jgi:hypothetical protein